MKYPYRSPNSDAKYVVAGSNKPSASAKSAAENPTQPNTEDKLTIFGVMANDFMDVEFCALFISEDQKVDGIVLIA